MTRGASTEKRTVPAPRGKRALSPFVRGIILFGILSHAVIPANAESKAFGLSAAGSVVKPVTAQLLAEHVSVQPGGTTRIGVLFELADGWHIYAEEPGDAGLPTTVTWSGPADVVIGPLQWPPHQEFLDPGDIQTFGYDTAVLLASELHVPEAQPEGELVLVANATWLACREICIPGSAALEVPLQISHAAPVPSGDADRFANAN